MQPDNSPAAQFSPIVSGLPMNLDLSVERGGQRARLGSQDARLKRLRDAGRE